MITLFCIYFFLLGVIIGSFLNVVILRHNTGRGTSGRSCCMTCGTQLTYKELVPVLSFLYQKGKCKTCKTRVSIQYPLVEFATGVLFAVNFYYVFTQSATFSELLFSIGITSCIWALMIVVFVYDLKHKIIPDIFSFTLFALSGMLVLFLNTDNMLVRISSGIFYYLVVWSIWKISKGRMIGLGDGKLLLSIGTLLGFVYTLSSIFIAVWIGTIYVIGLLLAQRLKGKSKHITMKTEIPFGPFLIIGFLIVYFTQIDVTNITFILENFS